MGVSNLLGNALLTTALKGAYSTYLSLHTAVPVDGGASNEVVGTNYARQLITTANWTGPTAKLSDNATAITFPTAGSSWGAVTYVGLYDALTGGNLLAWGVLLASKTINTGETITFSISQLTARVQ